MALVGVELRTLVFEPDALTTRSPPIAIYQLHLNFIKSEFKLNLKGTS